MEPDGPEQWHVAPVNDRGFLGSGEDDEEDAEPWWEETAADPGGRGSTGGRGGPVRRAVFGGNSPRLTVAVALAAAVLGVVVALTLVRGPSASLPTPTPSPRPSNGTGTLAVQVVGTVTAVSTASITIGGNGGSVTARFTAATKFSGQVTSPAGIKDGDQVAVVAAGTPSALTVASIRDPAS